MGINCLNTRWLVAGRYKQGHLLQGLKYWDDFEITIDSDGVILESPARWAIGWSIKELMEYYSHGDIEIDLTRKCASGGICIIDIMGNWCKFCGVPFNSGL